MKKKVLKEIHTFCESCPSHECCPEDSCVLFRIEKLILVPKKQKTDSKKVKKEN